MPETIISDNGRHFCGWEWSTLCETYAIKMALSPTGDNYHVGIVERQVDIAKRAFDSTQEVQGPKWAPVEILAIACSARNMTPNSTAHMSPIFVVTGRNDLIDRLINAVTPSEETNRSPTSKIWDRLQLLIRARSELARLES